MRAHVNCSAFNAAVWDPMIEWGGRGGGESASSCIQAEELPPLPSRSDPSPRVSHSSDQLPVASPSQTPQRVPAQAEGARPRPQCPMPTEGLQDCRPGDSEGCVTQAGRASLRPRAECSCCAACASLGRRVGPSRHPTQRSRSLAPAHSEAKRMRHCAHPVLLNCSSAEATPSTTSRPQCGFLMLLLREARRTFARVL
jgi:hypothetical protein